MAARLSASTSRTSSRSSISGRCGRFRRRRRAARLQLGGPRGVLGVERLQRLPCCRLPAIPGLLTECQRGLAVDRGRHFVSRPVAASHRATASAVVFVRGGVPSVDGEVDPATERGGVVNHDNLLVMDGSCRTGTVDGEVNSPAGDLVHHRHRCEGRTRCRRRQAAGEGWTSADRSRALASSTTSNRGMRPTGWGRAVSSRPVRRSSGRRGPTR